MKSESESLTTMGALAVAISGLGALLLFNNSSRDNATSSSDHTGHAQEAPPPSPKIISCRSTMMPGEVSQTPRKDSMGMDMAPVYAAEGSMLELSEHARAIPVCTMALVRIPGTPASAKPKGGHLLLTVPVTAVLDSSIRKLVYVEKGKGQFAPKEIVTGPRTDDSYPVLSGLSEGDRVVTRGNFLLDSQFQIRGLPSLFYKEGRTSAAGHQHDGAAPPTNDAAPTSTKGGSPTPAAVSPPAQDHTEHASQLKERKD